MRIVQLADKPGTAGHWSSEDQEMFYTGGHRPGYSGELPSKVRVINHYSTTMLVLPLDSNGKPTGDVWDWSTGHGSKSDQQGVNQILRAIGSDLYFSRKGGAVVR